MLKRKITERLCLWKSTPSHLPLLIDGARQVGKTTAVREFARTNYDTVYEINFFREPHLSSIFAGSLSASSILANLSVAFPEKKMKEGRTLIFLDEIQHCPNGRTALKFLSEDPRFDVIASGSLLGISHSSETSLPVGYVQKEELYPLDFEEFLWAMGIGEDIIGYLHDCFLQRKAVDEFIHSQMLTYFMTYLIVGGMPAVVASYAKAHDYSEVLRMQKDIVDGYRQDAVKYAPVDEKAKILRTFDSVPSQLARDYKKFQYSGVVKGARARSYGGALLWLKDAGVVSFCHNLSLLQPPLSGFAIENEFKVYMNDTGLLVSMYESGTAMRIMQGEIGMFKGALYENIIAQSLVSQSFPLFYFSPSDSLEIDFVIMYDGEPCLVEVKSGENKRSKSLMTVLANDRYGVKRAIRLSRNNTGDDGRIISLPLYMMMFVSPDNPDPGIVLSDADELRKRLRQQ